MLIPATRYHDPEAALAFITGVLGLDEHAVFRNDAGRIVHAQIRLGQGLMMFGPPQGTPFDRLMSDPRKAGGASFSVRDPEGHVWTFGDYDPLAVPS